MYRSPSPTTLGQADELEQYDDRHDGPRRGGRRHRRTVARTIGAVLSALAVFVAVPAPAGAHCSHMSGDPDTTGTGGLFPPDGSGWSPGDWRDGEEWLDNTPPPPPPPDDGGTGDDGSGNPAFPLPPPCEGDGSDGCA